MVLRRSRWELAGCEGGIAASLGIDTLLESHENGIASFLGGGGGAGVWSLEAGGGPQGMPGKLPERPFVRAGSLGGGAGAAILLSSDVIVVERDLLELASLLSSSCTSSNDDVQRRRAVRSGDFEGLLSDMLVRFSPSDFGGDRSVKIGGSCETRGVVTVEEDGGRSVNERIDDEDLDSRDCGRDLVSGASSKFSYIVSRQGVIVAASFALLTPSLSELSALEGFWFLSIAVEPE